MNDDNSNKKVSRVLWIIAGAAVCLIILFNGMVAMRERKKAEEKLQASPEKPPMVKSVTIQPREIKDSIVIPGRVEPVQRARLATEIAGLITGVPVDKGSRVEAGQVVLRLDNRAAEDGLKRAELMDRDAERDLARWSELQKTGAVSASDFDSMKKGRELAAIALREAKVRASQCEIRSPIPGIVNDRLVEAGEYAAGGAYVMEIVNIDEVKVAFSIPERDVLLVAQDSDMTFEVEMLANRVFTGRVTFVAAAAGRESNAFAAELKSANPGALLRPGMVARVTLVRKLNRQAIILPLAAVIPQKGDYAVFVVEQDRAVRRLVKLDRILGSEAIISEGVREGDNVVIEGGRSLVDGMSVKVSQ